MPDKKQCQFKKSDGTHCGGWSMQDSDFCFLHNPEISEEEKKETQSRGGQANKIQTSEPLPPVKIEQGRDIVLLLESTINKVRAGEMDLKVANCIGFLCGHLIRAFETADLQTKIETIERLILERKTTFKKTSNDN